MACFQTGLAGTSGEGDPVTRSLRFDANRSDSSLHRTFSGGSETNWTFSVWYKRTETGATDYIFNTGSPWGGYSGGTNNSTNQKVTNILIRDTNKLRVYAYDGSVETDVETDMLFRDPSAWYHIFVSWDSSQSSGSRYKIFVNGEEVSCTHTADSTNFINRAQTHGLGFYSGNAPSSNLGNRWPYLAGYLADCYFIDGTTLSTPVDKMIEATEYGSYKPKAFDMSTYSGNSFHIDAQPAHDADLLVSSVSRNDGDTLFADAARGHTITKGGDPEHSDTVGNPFDSSGTAISFDGTGDYLSVATSSDFDFGSGSYTYEGWFYFNGFSETPDGIFSRNNSSTQEWAVCTNSSGTLQFFESVSNSYNTSSFTFSTGQWYHIALCKNGTTYKVYVDADEKISATLSSAPDANLPVIIGRFYDNYDGYYLDGYCYDFRAQKGVDTGGSKPSAAFELNPIYIGADQSGNKNHFTPTGISGHDVMRDTPTTNFCTFSPISGPPRGTSTTISEGNLKVVGGYSGTYFMRVMGTVAVSSGKWFYEVRCGSNHTNSREYGFKGVNTHWPVGSYGLGGGSVSWATESEFAFSAYHGGVKFSNSSSPTTNGTSWGSDGDVIGLALDLDSSPRTLRVFKDGSEVGSATDIPTGGSTEWLPCIDETSYGPQTSVANFGQDPTFGGLESGTTYTSDNTTGVVGEFHNPIPSGYLPFAVGNLPEPTVTPSENFDTLIWQGDGVDDRDITGLGFDATDGALTWIKNRNNTTGPWHVWFDSARGAGHQIATNRTDTELPSSSNTGGKVSQWNTDGFRLKEGSGGTPDISTNQLNDNYVAWNWKAHQGGPVTRSHTMTLEVNDLYGSGSDWYNTKLEVWEGATKLADISQPDYNGGSSTTYTIKTNDTDKIKVVWDVDSSMDWYAMYAILKNSSNTTLASWDGNNYDGYSSTPADGSNFYIPSSHDSSNAATTGVVEGPTTVTESYNAAAGFSIITYSGNGSSDGDDQDLTHSLGAEPEFIITKARTDSYSADGGWNVYHKHNVASSSESSHPLQWLHHSWDSYKVTYSPVIPKSGSENTTITVNNDSNYGHSSNDSGATYVAYAWTPVAGYSHFGLWNADGTVPQFYHLGFRPAFVMLKCVNVNNTNWIVFDSSRETVNQIDYPLFPNTSGNEPLSGWGIDFLSNGFAWRSTSSEGYDGRKYIVCAWAETPAKFANAR